MSSWYRVFLAVGDVNYLVLGVMVLFGVLFFVPMVVSHYLRSRRGEITEPKTGENLLLELDDQQRLDFLMNEWKVLVDMQMHFNDMILRMRTLAVSVVISVFGAAGFAIGQYKDRFVVVAGHQVHVAAFVIAFGLILWLAVFLMDYGYYYRMLVGAVRRTWDIDSAISGKSLLAQANIGLFGAATKISQEIGPKGASKTFVIGFYLIVYLAGWLYLFGALTLL
jgi:hypothetical protein